jgi:hypothetical protein
MHHNLRGTALNGPAKILFLKLDVMYAGLKVCPKLIHWSGYDEQIPLTNGAYVDRTQYIRIPTKKSILSEAEIDTFTYF